MAEKGSSDKPRWHLQFQGKEYVFDASLVTVSALRKFKAEFGLELGRYLSFISAFAQGDPEAALCGLWLARKAAGETNVPEPNDMPDFRMDEFYDFFQAAGEPDPTREGTDSKEKDQTPASTGTPTSSAPATSDS
jgi:hypothetical protein